jgi:trimeric autotransporter adhesin
MQRVPSASRRLRHFSRAAVRSSLFPFLVAVLPGPGAPAQTPSLVKDIYPGVSSTASAPADYERILGVSGGKAFLNGNETGNRGLWVTDGSAGGTHLLLDVSAVSGADVGGAFYFGTVSQDGGALWKTDGTPAGTSCVSPFGTNPAISSRPSQLTKVGGRLFLSAEDGVHGAELWTSDGTPAGTRLVKDVTPGPVGSFDSSSRFVDLDGALLFSCGSDPGCGLWRSDGNEVGTVRLADLASVASLVNVNGTLFFTASDPTHGSELWKSDGTSSGTVLVRDILPGTASAAPQGLVSFGGALYFLLGSDGSTWKSDGTETGTVRVHSFPGSVPLVPAGGFLFTVSGSQLWASDGTEEGTKLARDFGAPFFLNSTASVPGALLFWVDRDVEGLELWRSDGTAAGTSLVEAVGAGDARPFPQGSVSIPGTTLHLLANMSTSLWRSDGTAAGTSPVREPAFRPNDGLPMKLSDVNGTLLFSAGDEEHGMELWRSDGTTGGTYLVVDLEPGPSSSFPGPFFATPSTVFFLAWTSAAGHELFRTDGTAGGTLLVRDIQPPDTAAMPVGLLGATFLFVPNDGVHGAEPWRSDGTADGTFLLGDLTPGSASSQVYPLGILNGSYLLVASDGASATLWKTDGTVAGTVAVTALRAAATGPGVVLGNALLFGASDAAHGTEIWSTDGTGPGTVLLLDINPSGDATPWGFSRLGDRVVFWADDGVHGTEPWVTDGSPGGTSLLKDINPGPARSSFGRSSVLGSNLFFWAYDPVHGYELWKTDGTGLGTVLVRDISEGPVGSVLIEPVTSAGHEVFFTASDHLTGRELWRSDGTEAGTRLVADLVPGIGAGAVPWDFSFSRTVLARSGGRIFFTATDGATGYELWSLPVPTLFHPVVPCRVDDTRNPDGPSGGPSLATGVERSFPVAGRCGIPSTAVSVALNLTVVSPSATGSLSVFAGGPVVSDATEVPLVEGKIRAHNLIVGLGTSGTLSVRASLPAEGSTDVVFDVSGYFE